jgi:hypothetical protein
MDTEQQYRAACLDRLWADTTPEERADFIRRHEREEWEWPDTDLVVRLAFEFADYDLPDDAEIGAITDAADSRSGAPYR